MNDVSEQVKLVMEKLTSLKSQRRSASLNLVRRESRSSTLSLIPPTDNGARTARRMTKSQVSTTLRSGSFEDKPHIYSKKTKVRVSLLNVNFEEEEDDLDPMRDGSEKAQKAKRKKKKFTDTE